MVIGSDLPDKIICVDHNQISAGVRSGEYGSLTWVTWVGLELECYRAKNVSHLHRHCCSALETCATGPLQH